MVHRLAAEEYAGRLVKESRKYGLQAMCADLQDYDLVCSMELHTHVAYGLTCMNQDQPGPSRGDSKCLCHLCHFHLWRG